MTTQPEWEKGRYISLLGDPIGPDGKPEPLRKTFWKSAGGVTLGASMAASALWASFSAASLHGNPAILTLLAMALDITSFSYAKVTESKWILPQSNFSSREIRSLCIDMKPDEKTPPTSERYGKKAQLAADLQKVGLFVYGAFQAMCLTADFSYGTFMAPLLAAGAGVIVSSRHRFNKVAKGDWAIVDMPKPKPVEAKQPILAPQTGFMTA